MSDDDDIFDNDDDFHNYDTNNQETIPNEHHNNQIINEEDIAKNYEEAKKLLCKSIQQNYGLAITKLNEITNIYELYYLLQSSNGTEEHSELAKIELSKLRNIKQINNLMGNIKHSEEYNIIKDCPICFESTLCVHHHCFHHFCVKCYIKLMDKCPMCK